MEKRKEKNKDGNPNLGKILENEMAPEEYGALKKDLTDVLCTMFSDWMAGTLGRQS